MPCPLYRKGWGCDQLPTELDVNAMDVLMSGEDMDLLENLDMYEWLEAEYG
ncbi:hypothetical protein [Thiothrix fructosivorans]|uniref:hypothetical protein n=1 Tax=Thiothrix fructosivorans TaxID=111770 RepID=UPI001A92974E|nr:hypothetical protein [Thiothrix fructosivorans]